MTMSLTRTRNYRREIMGYAETPEFDRQQQLFRDSLRAMIGVARFLADGGQTEDATEVYRAALLIGIRRIYLERAGKKVTGKTALSIISALHSYRVLDLPGRKLLETIFEGGKPVDLEAAEEVCRVVSNALYVTAG